MNLLPYENLTLHSPLSYDEAHRRLSDSIGPAQRVFSFSREDHGKAYYGEIFSSDFEIRRNINYRNSFLPVIRGNIQAGELGIGSIVSIRMRIHPIALVFWIFWCSCVAFACIAINLVQIRKHEFSPAQIIAVVMFLFGYGLGVLGFGLEGDKSKKDLASLFDAPLPTK